MSELDVRMVVLSTDDLDESIKFYTEALGMTLKFRDGAHFAALDGGSVTIALATAVDHPIPGQVVVGIKTDDVDAAAKAVVAIARNATIARLNRALHRLHTAVASVTARGEVTAVSLLFPSMCRAILPAQIRLRDASTVDTRKSILAWFDSVRTLAVEAALRGHMWSHAALCASTFMTLADPDDADDVGRRAEQARAVAARILDDRVRADLEDDLDRAVATFAAAPPDGPSIEDEAHMYREIIAGYGIDLADPKDPRAALARQGLLDLNPERALRHCVHAYIACGPLNAVASQLQMPSAAVKRLVCTLHGYEVENLVLDDAAREFKERFCTKCPDRSPHSEAWRWTRAWQARQDSPPKS